ncbi:MAG: sodium:calcium antiporter, partial [Thiovulaceae bacterium]|nr:sodium:calcium antiporter [Sulfurimonadaceae bacterium]
LFLISLGTSLPELMVSIVAVKKGNADMSIGNIIGSNVANFTMVLGGAALVGPLDIDIHTYSFDILVAVVASIMLLFITANRLYNRSAGIALMVVLALFINNALINLTS